METEIVTKLSEKGTRVNKMVNKLWNLSKSVAWIAGTSALVLVIPLLYEIDKELGPAADQQPRQLESQQTDGGSSSAGEAAKTGGGASGTAVVASS